MDECSSVYIIHYARRCSIYDTTHTFIYENGNGVRTPLIG